MSQAGILGSGGGGGGGVTSINGETGAINLIGNGNGFNPVTFTSIAPGTIGAGIGFNLSTSSIPIGPGDSPYALGYGIVCLPVDTTSGAVTINLTEDGTLPFGVYFIIKDIAGNASANNITINVTTWLIDGQTSYVINTDYGSVSLVSSVGPGGSGVVYNIVSIVS